MRTDEKITLWSERIHEFQSMNITVRRSRQSGVVRATCPD